MLDEEAEQLELTQGEVAFVAVDENLVGAEIDAQATALVEAGAVGFEGGGVGATQEGLDAGDDLARAERFDDIIVGAHLEAEHAIDFGALGGDDNDGEGGGFGGGAQAAAQFETG